MADLLEPPSAAGRSMQPLVSVVTPTRNQAEFIDATLRSVAGQTYARIEHIVIDGASTDGTLDVLRRFERSHPLRWISEPDEGMYDALNHGLGMANGEIVAYLNSDDLLLPWAVETAVEHLMAHPETVLVFGDALQIDHLSGLARFFFQPPFRIDYLRSIGSFAQPATFWRREIHDVIGLFDATLRSSGDLDFFLRVASRFRIDRIDEFLAVMRLHPGMKTRAQAPLSAAENTLVRERHGGVSSRGWRLVMLRSRLRAWVDRRRLWLAFAGRARRPESSGRWSRFLQGGSVRVSWARLLATQLPVIGLRIRGIATSGVDWLAVPCPPFNEAGRAAEVASTEGVA
jgi:glycosyltransferase involved in cell wall biosynthesis